MRTFKNEAEVRQLCEKEGKQLIVFEGAVYDVEDYMPQHPGGMQKIQELIG